MTPKIWAAFDKAVAQLDRRWAETWSEHVSNQEVKDDVTIRRGRLIASGVVKPGPDLTYVPWLDMPTLRLS